MISRNSLMVMSLVGAGLWVGCGDSDAGGPAADPDAGPPDAGVPEAGNAPAAPTYWDHVAPIMYGKCVGCHQAGGIAPFALDSYDSAKARAAMVGVAVGRGDMPPYYITHDGTCGSFEDAPALTADEKQTITNWVASGAAEGTKVTLTTPPRPGLEGGIEFKTPMFAPVPLGTQIAAHDDYRCFLVEPGRTSDTFITGYDVVPGNAAIVHHVIGMVVDPNALGQGGKTNAAIMKELDDRSPDIIGWDCFGGAGEGVGEKSSPVDWAPGQGVVAYPAGMGVPLRRTDKLVVQIHYNLADPHLRGMMDSTAIKLRFADKVDRQLAFVLPDAFLSSLSRPTPDSLAAGQPSVKYTWKKSVAQMGLPDSIPYADLIAVMPHMHGRGKALEMRIGAQPGGDLACAAKTQRWDFHWQKMYTYKDRPRLTGQTQIQVTCEYDTTADQAPVLPGWGTQNEMCLAGLMLALPPGM
jgi:hypothetical protein